MENAAKWREVISTCRTHSRMRCLSAIYLMGETQEKVTQKQIAEIVGVSGPTIHRFIESMLDEGLVTKEPYGRVSMTEKGRANAEYRMKHVLAMSEILGMRMKTNESESISLAFECVELMDHGRLAELEALQ